MNFWLETIARQAALLRDAAETQRVMADSLLEMIAAHSQEIVRDEAPAPAGRVGAPNDAEAAKWATFDDTDTPEPTSEG